MEQRTIKLWGATFIGIGAIVGGGIFALGGVALSHSGSGAMLAFLLNGVIALLTAASYAELASAFPVTGGSYSFAKRVLSVRTAFATGWSLLLAHIVAALLYAMGFAAYGLAAFDGITGYEVGNARSAVLLASCAATAFYTASLMRHAAGGGNKENILKLIIFAVLIVAGLWQFVSVEDHGTSPLSPLLPFGAIGLISAMGYTFIALQGFDIIAAVGGEIHDPVRTIPRAMFLSLGTALIVYIPLLFVIASVGTPAGEAVHTWCGARIETCIADAAGNYLGPVGYWLVVAAAIFATLSALQANILAASRIVDQMGRDRTLPRFVTKALFDMPSPSAALLTVFAVITFLLFVVPDLAAAGAAASLVFLVCFAFAHVTAYMARKRGAIPKNAFRSPFFPLIPMLGLTACLLLALFQGFVEPSASGILIGWLLVGIVLYASLFSGRAEALDSYLQASDPTLMKSRGRSPLVLVPVTNPSSAPALVSTGHALASPSSGRVLLLNVVPHPDAPKDSRETQDSQNTLQEKIAISHRVLSRALLTSMGTDARTAESLLTVSENPWNEIARVAALHRCESVLLGIRELPDSELIRPLDNLHLHHPCNLVFLRAPEGWELQQAKRILVPVGGAVHHDSLRARFLGALIASGAEKITLLRLVHPSAPAAVQREAAQRLAQRADDEARGFAHTLLEHSTDFTGSIVRHASEHDLVITGLPHLRDGHITFGPVIASLLSQAPCAVIVLGYVRGRKR